MYRQGHVRFYYGYQVDFLGDRARYPLKLRGKPLVTIPIVVADIKETKPQPNRTTAVFLILT